ncbi:Ger(x)C family spore germination protein [Paenibacillus dokdonensis]|uniref:Ger(x)C family spore germination protein n=1 Tax=Paenibacillus dokdonensis TaxID=2567944 RepID=UPI001457D3E6|nr:Ger(x)C family spore germination protein [Paenibacillus dokdonensis]
MKAIQSMILLLFCSAMLSGCWDQKAVQDMNIITAVGVDYIKGKYVIYGKLSDLSSVVASDSGGGTKKATSWVGRGEGPTVSLAFNDMYPSSQHQTLWTHVKSIVLTESALQNLTDIFEEMLRSRDIRYTPWVFATKTPIEEIFNAETTFNQSPLKLLMFEPREVYKQYSAVEPVRLQKLMNAVREPATAIMLPDISITTKHWKTNGKDNSMMELNGVFVIQQGVNKGWVSQEELSGARVVNFSHIIRFPLILDSSKGTPSSLSMHHANSAYQLNQKKGKLAFDVTVTVHANITEFAWKKGMDEKQMKMAAEQKLTRDILENFTKTQKKGIDLYGFEEWLYRYHYKLWKQKSSGGPLLPDLEMGNVKVTVKIDHSNTYKM